MSKTVEQHLKEIEKSYDGSKIPDANSIFNFSITGENGGDFTATIKDGKCLITSGLSEVPNCTVRSTDEVFVDVVTGKMNPTMAVMGGKLKISDIGEMVKFAKPFKLM